MGMSYADIRKHTASLLKIILENCRFFIVRRPLEAEGPSKPYKLEDFERLQPLKLVQIAELEREVQAFMDRNSLELEFSGTPETEGISSQ